MTGRIPPNEDESTYGQKQEDACEALNQVESGEEIEALEINFKRVKKSIDGIVKVIEFLKISKNIDSRRAVIDLHRQIDRRGASLDAESMHVVQPHNKRIKPHLVDVSNIISHIYTKSAGTLTKFFCDKCIIQEEGVRDRRTAGENAGVMQGIGDKVEETFKYVLKEDCIEFFETQAVNMIDQFIEELTKAGTDLTKLFNLYCKVRSRIRTNLEG